MKTILCFLSLVLPLSASALFIPPQAAVLLATASPLQYKGKIAMPGSSSSESCIFENEATSIVVDYCAKSREIPVVGIHIYPKGAGSSLNFYFETDVDPYTATRADYDENFWRLGIDNNAAGYKDSMSLEEHSAYLTALNSTFGCTIRMVQPLGLQSICNRNNPNLDLEEGADWLHSALAFRQTPSPKWFELLTSLRAAIDANL